MMIAGPARTPYEDGLFFFDLKFPKSFPRVPPQVHFISYGGELHPLLLEDGNFCQVNLNWKYDPSDNEIHQPKSYILEAAKTIQGYNKSLSTFPHRFSITDIKVLEQVCFSRRSPTLRIVRQNLRLMKPLLKKCRRHARITKWHFFKFLTVIIRWP